MSGPAEDLEVLTYSDFGVGIRWIAQRLTEEGWRPDAILGVIRGGLFVAAGLAYALNVKDLRTVNIEFYTGRGTTLAEPVLVGERPRLEDLAGRRVLIADDVDDTGHTMEYVRRLLPPGAEARVAVLYRKPGSVSPPDIAWRETARWIRFPWVPA